MTAATTPALAVQAAYYGVLSADEELAALVAGGVHDGPPETVVMPWIDLGEATEIPDNAHGRLGWQSTHTLHVWSQQRGFSEALTIARRVITLLDHQPLDVVGFHHVATRFEFLQTLRDPEPPGDIRHVPLRFRTTTAEI